MTMKYLAREFARRGFHDTKDGADLLHRVVRIGRECRAKIASGCPRVAAPFDVLN
jgi:hypothetical protein